MEFDVVWLLCIALAIAIALVGLADWTSRCRGRVEAHDAEEAAARAAGVLPLPPTLPVPPLVPDAHRPGTYLRMLVSPRGILGIIFLPLLVAALLGNGYVLADAFSIVLDRLPEPLLTVNGVEVSDLFLYGILLSIALLILSGVLAETERRQWVARLLALAGILSIFVVEYWSAWARGLHVAEAGGQDPLTLGVFNVAMAVATSTTESLAGYWTIHLTILPALLSIACGITALVRWVAFTVHSARWSWAQRPRGLTMLTRLGATLDAMFEPFRALDSAIAGAWRRFRTRPGRVTP